jgi:hypothetical protein
MLNIQVQRLTQVPADDSSLTPSGESAVLVCLGGVIHPELAALMPCETHIVRLPAVNGVRNYHVTVRGYTIKQFETITRLFAEAKFDEAFDLIDALKPRRGWYE